jgi:hypothetical protein
MVAWTWRKKKRKKSVPGWAGEARRSPGVEVLTRGARHCCNRSKLRGDEQCQEGNSVVPIVIRRHQDRPLVGGTGFSGIGSFRVSVFLLKKITSGLECPDRSFFVFFMNFNKINFNLRHQGCRAPYCRGQFFPSKFTLCRKYFPQRKIPKKKKRGKSKHHKAQPAYHLKSLTHSGCVEVASHSESRLL